MSDWEEEEGGLDEPERPLSREERLEALHRRREQSRRSQRSSQLLGLVAVAILFGGVAWLSAPLWWSRTQEPALDETLSSALIQTRAWANEGHFDEAEERLRRLASEVRAPVDQAKVRAAQDEVDGIRRRQSEGLRAVDAAVSKADRGALGEALGDLERLLSEYGELAEVRGRAAHHYEVLRERRRSLGGVEELAPYDAATEASVLALLEAGEYQSAMEGANSMLAADEEEEYSIAALQRKVREDTMAAARALLRRVERLTNLGKVLVAVQMLYREEIPEYEGTEAWSMLMQRAEEIEELIDARGGLRPFPRRRHVR